MHAHATVTIARNWRFVSVGGVLHMPYDEVVNTTIEHDTKRTSFAHYLRYIGSELMIFRSAIIVISLTSDSLQL